MLRAAFTALLLALALSSLTLAQDALDPKPAVWRDVQFGPEQVFEGDYTVNI